MKLAAKCQISLLLEFGAAVFRPETQHEVVVETNSHGSSSYQNVGDTRGQGFEISLTGKVADDWRVSAGFTHLQAQLLSAFDTCFSTPCTRPTLPVAAGSRIPGVPDNYGALRLRHGAEFAPGARALI